MPAEIFSPLGELASIISDASGNNVPILKRKLQGFGFSAFSDDSRDNNINKNRQIIIVIVRISNLTMGYLFIFTSFLCSAFIQAKPIQAGWQV